MVRPPKTSWRSWQRRGEENAEASCGHPLRPLLLCVEGATTKSPAVGSRPNVKRGWFDLPRPRGAHGNAEAKRTQRRVAAILCALFSSALKEQPRKALRLVLDTTSNVDGSTSQD